MKDLFIKHSKYIIKYDKHTYLYKIYDGDMDITKEVDNNVLADLMVELINIREEFFND